MAMKDEVTIFYTDDDQDDLEFFREIVDIIDSKFVVVTQNSASELLLALENPPPTPFVVFLDINMPGINGLEILKKLRELENHRELPIVIFSTSSDELTIEKSRSLGANYYLPKSGVFDKLRKSIQHTLSINWKEFAPATENFVYHYS